MGFNIVLIEPEIPTNTGNIGRLSLAAGSTLHLIKPFGFEINDKRVKRAGLDYWQHVSLFTYENVEEFFTKNQGGSFAYLSSHGTQEYDAIPYQKDMFLIFGKESVGLSKEMLENNSKLTYKIPIHSPHIRSLNLANAVSIVVYEGLQKIK